MKSGRSMFGLERLPRYGRAAAVPLAAVGGLLLFHAAWVAPRRDEIALRELELGRKRTEIAAALDIERRLPEVAAEVAALEARLAGPGAGRRGAPDSGALLRRLQKLARAESLSIRAFAPQAPASDPPGAGRPNRLELAGTYHGLLRFLDQVGRLSPIVRIDELDVRAVEAPGPGPTVVAAGTATAFALAAEEPGASAAPPRGAPPDPEERRDPFAGLSARAGGAPPAGPRPRGLAGVRVDELVLRGLVLAGGRRFAVLEAPGRRTYFLRGGERLLDGSVQTVTDDAVVFLQEPPSGPGREARMTLADAAGAAEEAQR